MEGIGPSEVPFMQIETGEVIEIVDPEDPDSEPESNPDPDVTPIDTNSISPEPSGFRISAIVGIVIAVAVVAVILLKKRTMTLTSMHKQFNFDSYSRILD